MRLQIDWASLIVGSKLPFLCCFTLYLRAIFQVQAPGGAYIWRADLTEGFLSHRFEGLIFGGAYTWRGLFSEFYGMFILAIPVSFAPAQKPYRIGLLFIYNGQL